METTRWTNVYGKTWGKLCAPGLAAHPAKYSRALIYRIVDHMARQGYAQAGDTVLDPFGGVALGAIPLIERGIHWAGVELEKHFVKLAQANIDLWNARYQGRVPNWGRATIFWGDSRYLLPAVARGRFGAVVGSPPYARSLHQRGHGIDVDKMKRERGQGRDLPAIDAIGRGYGAVVGSPPYGDSDMRGGATQMTTGKHTPSAGYGSKSVAQLGHATGSTFWAAAKCIVSACYDLLRPDGVAVWVVKDYCRNWELVPFCDRWLDLQLACGFEHIETIIASQVDNPGVVQQGLFGDDAPRSTRHGGLFRNLYEGKGGPVIDPEMVFILEK